MKSAKARDLSHNTLRLRDCMCVWTNWANLGSDNGLSHVWQQAILWINAGLLLTGPLATNFSESWTKKLKFSYKKMDLKMSSGKRRPFCLRHSLPNELIACCILAMRISICWLAVSRWACWLLFYCASRIDGACYIVTRMRVDHIWLQPMEAKRLGGQTSADGDQTVAEYSLLVCNNMYTLLYTIFLISIQTGFTLGNIISMG